MPTLASQNVFRQVPRAALGRCKVSAGIKDSNVFGDFWVYDRQTITSIVGDILVEKNPLP